MVDLPDLDTDNIGFIGYWNAIDQGGADDINPDEVITDNLVDSYTLYDNGVEGKYELTEGRLASFRVKNDGWMILYMDGSAGFVDDTNLSNLDVIRGPWDILEWAPRSGSESDIISNEFFVAIDSMISEFSNSGDISITSSQVALYNYDYPSSTTVTLFSASVSDPFDGVNTTNLGMSYSSATNRDGHWMVGKTGDGGGSENKITDFQSNDMTSGENRAGSKDVLAEQQQPNSETEYTQTIQCSEFSDSDTTVSNLMVWY